MAKVKPVFESGFEQLDPGVYIGLIEDWKFNSDEEDKECRIYRAQMRVQGGGSDGAQQSDFFRTKMKKNFGLRRLAGMMMKAGVIPEGEEVDTVSFLGEAKEQKIKEETVGKLVGFEITSRKYEGKTYMQISKYLTVKEAQEAQAGATTSKGQTKTETKKNVEW